MSKQIWVRSLVFLVLLCMSGLVLAQSQPLTIVYQPSEPAAFEPFDITITYTSCDAVGDAPFPPVFDVSGNVLRLTVTGVVNPPSICIFPPQTVTYGAPALPPGSYTFQVRYRDPNIADFFTLRQSAPLVVVGVNESVPIDSKLALLLLTFVVAAVGAIARRRS